VRLERASYARDMDDPTPDPDDGQDDEQVPADETGVESEPLDPAEKAETEDLLEYLGYID
jgi:hypothetical protein